MDPTTIGATLSASSNLTAILKGIVEKVKASGKSEALGDFIEIQVALMDLLQKQQDLIEENRALRDEVRSLKEIISTEARFLELNHDAYWQRID